MMKLIRAIFGKGKEKPEREAPHTPPPRNLSISAALYVDHQDEVDYPIALVSRDWTWAETIYFFASDEQNLELLEKVKFHHPLRKKIVCIPIGKKIEAPHDIAIAQNQCLSYLRKKSTSDFFVFVQADILITPRAYPILMGQVIPERITHALHLTVRHIRLFTKAHHTYYGVTILGRKNEDVFTEDGAYLSTTPHYPHEWNCLDIGFFGIDQYYRHIARHQKTWKNNQDFADMAELYGKDRRLFIKAALDYRDWKETKEPLVIIDREDPIYRDVIESLHLEKEYDEVRTVIDEKMGWLTRK